MVLCALGEQQWYLVNFLSVDSLDDSFIETIRAGFHVRKAIFITTYLMIFIDNKKPLGCGISLNAANSSRGLCRLNV